MGNLTLKIGLNQHIAGKEQLLLHDTLAIAQLGILLCRQQNLANIIGQECVVLHQSLEILLHLSLLATNGTQNIPFLASLSHFTRVVILGKQYPLKI